MGSTKVGQLASRSYRAVGPQEPLDQLAAKMGSDGESSVLVVSDGRPTGIVSEADIVRFLAAVLRGEKMLMGTAGDVMTSPVMTAHEDDLVQTVADLMERNRIRSVPVVDDQGRLTGLIRFTDVLHNAASRLARQRDELEVKVAERTSELHNAHEALKILVRTDGLLGIGNRRAMDLALTEAHGRARRYGSPYAVLLADVDHFKKYNDTHGHQAGDEVLRQVARVFEDGLRATDAAFRYGGEELLALLPETNVAGALIVAERLRAAVASLAIPNDGAGQRVTISMGVSAWTLGNPVATWEQVVESADGALYEAKAGGRNRVANAMPVPISPSSRG